MSAITAARSRVGAVALAAAVGLSIDMIDPQPVSAATSWSVPVLMYHDVVPAAEVPTTTRYPGLYVDTDTFNSHMAALKAWGWRSISTRDLADAMRSGRSLPARSIVISFDDGRLDNYKYAVPILEQHGFRGVFYIVGSRVDVWSNSMTSAQLVEMATNGHEIANHTWTHPDLTTLSYDQARSEIRRNRDLIKRLTGVSPVSIAYPYGRSNSTVRSAATAEGMYLGFVTDGGYPETVANRLNLHRVRVAGMTRRSDGSFGGGETAAQLLRELALYAGPVVTTPVTRLSRGTTIGATTVPVRTTWSGKDPTGVTSYGLRRQAAGGSWSSLTLSSATATSYVASLAYATIYRYRVRATNGTGTTSPYTYGSTFTATLVQETSDAISWTGTWLEGVYAPYSGGHTMYAMAADASATFTFTGSSVAWVSKLGPTRGSAAVYLDDQLVATISLHAASFTDRRIVYAASWIGNEAHTLRIVSLGTAGHPRVDVDAFVVLSNS